MSTNTIESLALNSFIVDEQLSGRTSKEIATNAAELAPIMAAAGKWLESEPGEYFVRDGKNHLRTAFTRRQAAINLGWTEGLFVQVEDEPLSNLLACVRTNTGRGISAYQQGKVYAELRDGTPDYDAETGRSPMDIKDIAKLTGKSFVWISQCLGIFESTPEIGALILADKISAGVAIKAKQIVKDDNKRFQMLESAVAEAVIEGKQRASESHLDAVKHKYLPKPKAVETPKPASNAPESPAIEPEQTFHNTTPIASNPQPIVEISEILPPLDEPPSLDLTEAAPVVAKQFAKLIPKFRTIINEWTDELNIESAIASDGNIATLCKKLAAVVVSEEEVF